MLIHNYNKFAVFGYLAAKRLYPNYVFFSRKYDFGNPHILEKYLREIRVAISNASYLLDLDELQKEIDKVTPAPEDYGTVLASSAMDACAAIYELASYIETADIGHIVNIVTLATDSVDMYVQEILHINTNLPGFEEKISAHPLMVKEKKVQDQIWQYFRPLESLEAEDLVMLENLQFNDGMGNLDLPL